MSTIETNATATTSAIGATISRRRRVAPAAVAVLGVLLTAGCTTGTAPDGITMTDQIGVSPTAPVITPAPTTAATPTTPTTAPPSVAVTTIPPPPAPTPTPAPTPPLVADPGCGAWAPVPPDVSGVSSASIDALGDGSADDTITSYLDGTWRVRLVSSAGVVSELAIDDVGPGYAKVIGAVQIDEQAGDQVLAVVGSGASGVRLGVFGADEQGCVFRFTHSDGAALDLIVGGTTRWHQGVFCAGNTLFSYGADAVTDDEWQVWGVDLQRTGATTLGQGVIDSQPGVATADLPVYGLACPGLSL